MISNIQGNEDTVNSFNLKILNNFSVFIFYGIEGIGKYHYALKKAYEFLCLDSFKEDCKCESCLKYPTHTDILKVRDSEKSISIDKIRELKDSVKIRPVVSSFKFLIIDDANKMTVQAANTLLKVLEESPPYLKTFFITSSHLLSTIESRAIKFYFKPLDNDIVKKITAMDDVSSLAGSPGLLYQFGKSAVDFNTHKACELFSIKINPLIYAQSLNSDLFNYTLFKNAFFYKFRSKYSDPSYSSLILYNNMLNEFEILSRNIKLNANAQMTYDSFVFRIENIKKRLDK
jgi:DNA polymerase III delta prime subunit